MTTDLAFSGLDDFPASHVCFKVINPNKQATGWYDRFLREAGRYFATQ